MQTLIAFNTTHKELHVLTKSTPLKYKGLKYWIPHLFDSSGEPFRLSAELHWLSQGLLFRVSKFDRSQMAWDFKQGLKNQPPFRSCNSFSVPAVEKACKLTMCSTPTNSMAFTSFALRILRPISVRVLKLTIGVLSKSLIVFGLNLLKHEGAFCSVGLVGLKMDMGKII